MDNKELPMQEPTLGERVKGVVARLAGVFVKPQQQRQVLDPASIRGD